ncbi:hypothetical protein BG844_20440 [Couchioplanes caeruleus subsp. caeruleus]|uniref:CDP-alcohol phosphatidyltransferase n=1 Tax=Couchioplanes caeruleus subsp. caeruleus TaxID=56427 RepID=A0A1K0FIB3_9ACTN|nr:hypothetical protein BG844_20440 [Couchioplanes caeruleus subsp. caeruleus]
MALLVSLWVTVGLGLIGSLVGLGFTACTWVLLNRALNQPDVRRWGPADSITFGRLILTGGVASLVADAIAGSVHHLALVALAVVSLVLDAGDGQVARRTGTASRFGARFDMEADSVLAVVLSIYVATHLGWWAVAMGLFRYFFAFAARVTPWLNARLPPRLSRKVVAASQGAVLVVTSTALLPATMAQFCVALTLAALSWSFGVDVRWLWRQEALRRKDARAGKVANANNGPGVDTGGSGLQAVGPAIL